MRGYELVIWGTAEAATSGVTARYNAGTARAAVFDVPSSRGERAFSLFVVELPLAAASAPVTVVGEGPGAEEQVPPQARLCRRS